MIDRVAARLGRRLYEVPVGFKWFADGLFDGSLGFGGEESAGASFLRRDGTVWTTDKDGIVAGAARRPRSRRAPAAIPGELYRELARDARRPGRPIASRRRRTAEQKKRLAAAVAGAGRSRPSWRASRSRACSTSAPGNGAAIGGIKVDRDGGWFAARPSGTEDIYKIYGESFSDERASAERARSGAAHCRCNAEWRVKTPRMV